MASTTETRHYLALDGARGLAAIAVFLYHYKAVIPVFGLISGSFLAVDLFFVMSGLVVARAYERQLIRGEMGFGRFVAVRVLRLFPLYLAACAIGLVHYLGKIAMATPDAPQLAQVLDALPMTLLMLPTPGSEDWAFGTIPFATSAWSLTFEFWFNLVYALLLPRLPTRVLLAVALAALAVLVWQMALHQTADLGWSIETTLGGSARFWFSFSIGVAIHRLNLLAAPGRVAGWALFALTFAFVLLPADAILPQLIWIVLVFPAFVIFAARLPVPSWLAAVFDQLGRLSYGIYILHASVSILILGQIKAWAPDLLYGHDLLLALLLFPAVLLVAAVLTYRFDEPLRAGLAKRGRAGGQRA